MRKVLEKEIAIIIAGTGGHIFPGIALAEEIREKGRKVFLLGRKRGMEEKIAEEVGLDFLGYPFFKSLFSFGFFQSIVHCLFLLWRRKPWVIINCGSYASLPPLLAGIILGLPIYILEQNRIPGRMTKVFAPFARWVFFGFPPQGMTKDKVIWTGNPIRKRIKKIKERKEEYILVLGGSQGARSLSLFLKNLARDFPDEQFLIQVREEDLEKLTEEAPGNCSFFIFTSEIERILSRAKLVVSRAGGSTVSEILYLGLPAVLIPYPYATQNHQEANALFCVGRGCALMIRESEFLKNWEKVKKVFQSLLRDDEKRKEMGKRAKELSRDGTKIILERLKIGG
ncbi:MAG: UDP-N-acetylglucosamine--N-acetylmuramyl-(pentapeptide) pyrophosphoryl-undecaprenol N-acetylglucosamine transferase [candidate division WOR-3 bacterium]